MFLSLSTTHHPASDLGFLLMKHPERLHEFELSFGRAFVFYPKADDDECEAALVLDVDPVGLVRGRGAGDGLLDAYVNDRPYAASSFLSVALNRAFRTAMAGTSRDRPELAATPIPLTIMLTPLPVRGADEIVERLFAPLGWSVEVERIAGAHGPSRYVTLRLRGVLRLADALSHLYVLIPALDGDKHYWITDDEVEKLLDKGAAWLASHPERDLIARRYLKNKSSLVRSALARLAPEEALDGSDASPVAEETIETPIRLNDLRMDAVVEALVASGATHVADLGCGEGRLISRLLRHNQFAHVTGLDAGARALERASARLKLERSGGPPEGRVTLLHGALTYRDERWHGAEAAALVEVIEHLDADRLPALEAVVFGAAQPKTVIVTTPNVEHNVLFETLTPGAMRHSDHRFEWTRAQFRNWAASVEQRYGYRAAFSDVGEAHALHGAPTQMAVFTR